MSFDLRIVMWQVSLYILAFGCGNDSIKNGILLGMVIANSLLIGGKK